ncbi:suppressor of tumorigenicity 14 protein homolog isoform X2 [Planococcus citri]|uniref:suppressor of tumorigenicity 14 protein homolog isoform X2 n=1 Tax=Planococcus citri TaxID=170843 RepID=UPI0031F7D673
MVRLNPIDRVNHTRVYFLFLNYICFIVLCSSESYGSRKENKEISHHIRSEFQKCAYGQCVSSWNASVGQTRRKRATDNSCTAPSTSPARTIKYTCNGSTNSDCITNGIVSEFTSATISCNSGYSSRNEGNEFHSFCLKKTWSPQIEKCHKICDPLIRENVDLECFYRDTRISCDDNSLIAGVRVIPTCKHLYTYKDIYPTYREIKCGEDGKWDKTLFSCVPECGLPFDSKVKPLISYSTAEHFGDSPWHVAIYNENKMLICGGTIITTKLILSAAHCFYNDATNTKLNAENYEVVVSKFTRTYTTKDNSEQKVFKVKEIRFSKRGYIGLENRYAADIAILILNEGITISPSVLPACVYWTRPKRNPLEGVLGKVVGWGLNEKGDYPENLTTTNLPYISHSRCLDQVPIDYRVFITFDKFCAGSETGPAVLNGDSGGGLMFVDINYHSYIRGIVSVKQNSGSPTGIATFTNVEDHLDWITEVRDEIESSGSECGHKPTNSNNLSPWHVNIRKIADHEITWGGTIISPRMILSIELNIGQVDRNFVSDSVKINYTITNKMDNPNDFEVVTGFGSSIQKSYKIEGFRFMNGKTKDYNRLDQLNNIVIIILYDGIFFKPGEISPICVEWTNPSTLNDSERTAEIMTSPSSGNFDVVNSNVLSHHACVKKNQNNSTVIRDDQFCLSFPLSHYARSHAFDYVIGTGVILKQNSRYYIRGISSYRFMLTKGTGISDLPIFAGAVIDIAHYINWIKSVRDTIL